MQGGRIAKPKKRSPKKDQKVREAIQKKIQGGKLRFHDPIHRHLHKNLSGRGGRFDPPFVRQKMHQMLSAYQSRLEGKTKLKDRISALAEVRSEEGYMAEAHEDGDGGFALIENHCPICAAATECQNFCRSELAIFQQVLGPDATVERTDHLLAGARRCAYRITPGGAPSTI